MPNLLYPTRLASALAAALFSLPVCAAGLGGLNDDYTPPPAPVKPKPRVVEKPVTDRATEKRTQIAEAERKRLEAESRRKDAEITRLRALEDKNAQLQAELDKAHKQPPKVVEQVVEKAIEKPVPVPVVSLQLSAPVTAGDPASACWKNGTWAAACAFAAYGGGPVFRVVGGNLSFTMGTLSAEKVWGSHEGPHFTSVPGRGMEEGEIIRAIEPKFSRLTVFDPRIPHGVRQVTGTHDPREGRLVVHGWFVQPRPFVSGSLPVRALEAHIAELTDRLGGWLGALPISGLYSVAFDVDRRGGTSSVRTLSDTTRVPRADERARRQLIRAIREDIAGWRFGPQRGGSRLTLPLVFERG